MATVEHYGPFQWYGGGGYANPFNPGQQHLWSWGPWAAWRDTTIIVTAHPFDGSNSTRSLLVTDVRAGTSGYDRHHFYWTVRNTGPDVMWIYYMYITLTRP